MARLGGEDVAAVSSPMGEAPPAAMWNTYVWVESADATAAKVREAGGKVLVEPFDVMEAGRMAVCADREGAVFCLWQAKRHRGAQVVNEHGALNFNDLNTPRPRGARRSSTAPSSAGSCSSWAAAAGLDAARLRRVPRQLNPGALEQMAEMGAPAGLRGRRRQPHPDRRTTSPTCRRTGASPSGSTTPTRPPPRRRELGGTVLAEPFDAPWVRMTVIADPQGATFTASKFVPENKDL